MSVIHSPPPSKHLIKRRVPLVRIAAFRPRFVRADEVDHIDAGLEVTVGWKILVVSGGGHVVREADAVVVLPEVHIQQALVGTVERDAPLSHSNKCVVVAHVGRQDHDTRVEKVRPANVGRGRKRVRDAEEFIRGPVCDNIGIDVYDFRELCLFPQVDLGESRVQVGAVHQIQVGGSLVAQTRHGDDMVVDGLELCDDLGGDGVECDQDGQLMGGTSIAQGMSEDQCAWEV